MINNNWFFKERSISSLGHSGVNEDGAQWGAILILYSFNLDNQHLRHPAFSFWI